MQKIFASMAREYFNRLLIILVSLNFMVFAACRHPDPDSRFGNPAIVDPAFDLCSVWKPGLSWDDFQNIRTHLERSELIPYVNKIESSKMLKSRGIPVIPVIYAATSKEDFSTILDKHKEYVAKPAHMSQNNGLVIIRDGINVITGKAMSSSEVQTAMHKILDTPSNSNEWVLQNMPRGFIVQEFINKRHELKIQTIFGKAVAMSWLEGEDFNYYYYYIDGKKRSDREPDFPYGDLLEEAIKIAEKSAEKTDFLRVDLMIRFNPDGSKDLMVNELELRSQMGWPDSQIFARLINAGYRTHCI